MISIFIYESKHFLRSPFKIVAFLLFILAGVYGLYKGQNLYEKQTDEVIKTENKIKESRAKYLDFYKKNIIIPINEEWIDLRNPKWALDVSYNYHIKHPAPAMVFSTGQAEQYGFIKRINHWSSPYDKDLAEELANPERLQTGRLDFSFAILFLSPLLLLILVYNIKSIESEQGFITLIQVQSSGINKWVLIRFLFYVIIIFLSILSLIFYGASLTDLFADNNTIIAEIAFTSLAYLILWSILFLIILLFGRTIIGNTLKMIGLYILFAFIVPATVYQVLSIKYPLNLMVNFLDSKLKKDWATWDIPAQSRFSEIAIIFPDIWSTPHIQGSEKYNDALRQSTAALTNEFRKISIQTIEEDANAKNKFIESTYIFNPLTYFQNRFNSIAETHFDDYQKYRSEIQELIDKQIQVLVLDMWRDVTVDEKIYLEYYNTLTKN